ncbi:MAG: hypothetical protein ACE5GF_02805 [Thermodesulfobacteriota bacterium]
MSDRKDLINELLKKSVTYSDIRKHKLDDNDIKNLHFMNCITQREFVCMYRQMYASSRQEAYTEWRRQRKRHLKYNTAEITSMYYHLCRSRGFDINRVKDGYENHLLTGQYFTSTHDYVELFLAEFRDELYTQTPFQWQKQQVPSA